MQQIQNAIDLLELDQRNEEDVKVIMKGTRHLKFFQELLQSKNKHRLHYLTCKYMTLRSYDQGDIIFKESIQIIITKDDIPDNFYIILRGTANVYCKKKFMNIEQQQVMGEYNSLDETKRKYHIVELLQKMKKLNLQPKLIEKMRQNKNYTSFIKETGGLLPEQFSDYDYFFEGGVFTQNLIVQLQQGDIFGELGLLLGQKRSATVLAHTNLKLAIICKEDYQNILQADQFRKIHKKLNFLYNNFFLNMPNQLTTQYAYDFKKQKLPNGFVIFKQGQLADQLFIIKHGEVDIQMLQPDGFKLKVSKLGEGQIFGETEFFKKTNRQSTAVVVSEFVKILSLQYYQFEKALEQLPQLMENFQNKLIQKDNFIEKIKQRTISIKLKTEPTKSTQQVDSEFQNYCSNDLISKIKNKIQQYKNIGLIPSQQQVSKYQQEFNQSLADIQVEQKQFTKIALTRPNLLPFNEQVKLKRSQQSSILLRSVINPSDSSLVDRKDVLSYQFSIDQQRKSRMDSKIDSKIDSKMDVTLSKVRSESNLSPSKNVLIKSQHNMFRKMPTRNFLLMKLQYRKNQ